MRIYSINLKKSRIGPVNPAQNVNEGTFTDVCKRQRCKANHEPLDYNNRTALDVRYLVYLGHGKQREQRSPRQTSRIAFKATVLFAVHKEIAITITYETVAR